MKILFLIDNPPIAAVSTWNEIKKCKAEEYDTPGRTYYAIFKALELNSKFEQEILQARRQIGIPESGIAWDDYYTNYYMRSLSAYNGDEKEKYDKFFSSVKKEAKRMIKEMNLNIYVEDQIDNLIIGGFVFPEDTPISYEAIPNDNLDPTQGNSNVYIRIKHSVTQHELKTYIEENWIHLYSLVKELSPKLKLRVSTRDLRIVELKDKLNLGWNEIIEKITDEFNLDDDEGELNLISVKRAYTRAKNKIHLITDKST